MRLQSSGRWHTCLCRRILIVALLFVSTSVCRAAASTPSRLGKEGRSPASPTAPHRLKRHVENSVQKLTGGARSIKFGAPIPLPIPPNMSPPIRDSPPSTAVVKRLKILFADRPVWSTLALRNTLEDTVTSQASDHPLVQRKALTQHKPGACHVHSRPPRTEAVLRSPLSQTSTPFSRSHDLHTLPGGAHQRDPRRAP